LEGAAPNLRSFITERCSSGRKYFLFQESPLTTIVTQDARYLENLAQPSLLQVLEIPVRKARYLLCLHQLSQLQRLTLDFFSYEDEDPGSLDVLFAPHGNHTPLKISLPFLTSMSWLGSVPSVIFDAFETPAVQHLQLLWENVSDFTSLPNVNPFSLYWEVLDVDISTTFLVEIYSMFERYSRLHTITVPRCHMREVLTALADIREQSRGLKNLFYITFVEPQWDGSWDVWELNRRKKTR
jgi:hypothetical protein